MRTHSKIISDAGGVTPIRRGLASLGVDVADPTLRSWERRPEGQGAIPPEYWPFFIQLGFSTAEELMSATVARKLPDLAKPNEAAA